VYTNTSCTIYAKTDSGYNIIPIPACYFREVKAQEVKKYGAELADSVKVIIPLAALDGYKTAWDIPEGSYIMEGTSTSETSVSSIAELVEAGVVFSINSVTNDLRGSDAVKHISIGAR